MLKSRVNQPTRVFISSSDDNAQDATNGYNDFSIVLQTPLLNGKKLQLLRCTIPNAQINIPDYMLTFWYYNLPSAGAAPSAATLKCVRLYPSWYVAPAALGTAYTKNRFFSDPADFVAQLNTAAAAGGDNVTYNPYWTSGDVTFAYNATTKQISMTGATAGRFYAIAGWNDPNVAAAQPLVLMPNFNGGGNSIQPYNTGNTLNLRVGYAMSGNSVAPQILGGNPQLANLTNTAFANAVAIPPDSFPNLVYTSCVYLYSDIVAGSSVCSNKAHNLLAVIPVNAPQLGVIQYVAATLTWLDKIPDNIYEIRVQMFDENNVAFQLPDSAVVNFELGISYD